MANLAGSAASSDVGYSAPLDRRAASHKDAVYSAGLVPYALSTVLTVEVCRYGYNTNTQLLSYKGGRHFKTASFS